VNSIGLRLESHVRQVHAGEDEEASDQKGPSDGFTQNEEGENNGADRNEVDELPCRYSSRAMVMAPFGQMKAQIPQPLQKS